MRIYFLLPLIALLAFPALAQDHHERYESIDVLSYQYNILLSDSSDEIHGIANIKIAFKKDVDQFQLDLKSYQEGHGGMQVMSVSEDDHPRPYVHLEDQLIISIPETKKGTHGSYQIAYRGIPSDGLIISENMFGDRTFFGDNWPNRGHHWLPMVDHPSDKALVEFYVSAPDHYSVVSVGKKMNELIKNGNIVSHWKTLVPISTKLMVIGVSPFAVDHMLSSSGISVSSWVYPQNQENGFYDYSIATKPLDFFESYIAPYPYAKLANVQSKTVYGGMENASCIFYHERTVTGKQKHETLFAHEIAHQWFGDAVSELDWHHIWLSEGFATYLTDIYIENSHGREAFVASMLDEKEQVIRFAHRRLAPIVDTSLAVSTRLLNKNTYEKAGWVLHMLRHEMGDKDFQECIQTFYSKFKFRNALTEDFQEVVEAVSGKSYDHFFQQWFYESGHPVLSSSWKQRRGKCKITIQQNQEQFVFAFPLEVLIKSASGESRKETLIVDQAKQEFIMDLPFKASEIILDPDSWLLFEFL